MIPHPSPHHGEPDTDRPRHPIRGKLMELREAGADLGAMTVHELRSVLGSRESLQALNYHRSVLKAGL
jgi:hypothetical protein